ncbi:hypothetical protein [Rhabdaerophilum sp. SD176]|uniref:hypothetical protein n=1 Tax=Rhabdaerophilum sp. SD176 TaxID=2983548 RepID=UPI0024E01C6E|nr:hypothetical protein [Rhabdaerophilum sp. SD176]
MSIANQERGLRLADADFVYLSEGAYGIVFVDRVAARIRKIYRRKPDEKHTRNVFESEVHAYRLAMGSESLQALVPAHFRLCVPQRIFDSIGTDVTAEFFPDLAFEAEFVDGRFSKIGDIDSREADKIRDAFHSVGIKHTIDMSVCVAPEGHVLKAIDFAVEEHELWYSD